MARVTGSRIGFTQYSVTPGYFSQGAAAPPIYSAAPYVPPVYTASTFGSSSNFIWLAVAGAAAYFLFFK